MSEKTRRYFWEFRRRRHTYLLFEFWKIEKQIAWFKQEISTPCRHGTTYWRLCSKCNSD